MCPTGNADPQARDFMFSSLRQRTSDEGGFTLIELLVVVLIIGILAAIAIPSLLAQKSKAYSASAKALATSSETAAETYGTDNNDVFKGLSPTVIHEYEKNIPTTEAEANGTVFLEKAEVKGSNERGYKLTVKAAHTGSKFSIERTESGEVIKTCEPNEVSKGCPENGSW
jgi:prepilin-type N-terminal cleavage/methylation domain-containing protein